MSARFFFSSFLLGAGPLCVPAVEPGWPRVFESSANHKTSVHLIGVQPYSGGAGTLGFKIEPMIQLALEHIEAHPTILPDHKLAMHFVDSGCSGKKATDVIFEQHVVGPKKFGVFGAACTGACMAASDVSRNFKTTNFAQLCTGTAMSDTTTYPEFARFAPDLDKNSQTAVDLTSLFGWKRVAVVMENQGLFTSMGEGLANKIREDPMKELISFEKIFPMATDLEANLDIASVVGRLIDAEARIVLFVGYEQTIARMFCEASKRGFVGRKVVFVYATFWINADWYQEFASATRCEAQEILEASQGLVGIDRLRLANDTAGAHNGSGWLPSAIMQEYHSRCDPEMNTSDPSRYGCSDMHAAYSYDALWGWAFTLDRWLRRGHNITEVDYVSSDARRSFFETEVSDQDFLGLTGRVRHYPNGDRDGELQIFQVQGTEIKTLASVVDQGQTFAWSGVDILWGGLQNHSLDPATLLVGNSTSNDGAWPMDGPETCDAPLHLVADPQDVLGTERCEPCSGGHRRVWDIDLQKGRCLPCDEGTARADAASSPGCITCLVGTFANETGMTECQPCPPGHTCPAGTATPQPCGLGGYAPGAWNDTECMQCDAGSYAAEPGMSSCLPCEQQLKGSTSPEAARSAAECRCDEGFLLLAGHGCVECDALTMDCPGGLAQQHVAVAKRGYYLTSETPVMREDLLLYPTAPVAYKCSSVIDCPGNMPPNECPVGHVGLVCAVCDDDYTRRGGSCLPCGEQHGRMALIFIVGAVGYLTLVVAIMRMSTDSYKFHLTLSTAIGTPIGFLVTFLQLHEILGVMAVAWPSIFKKTVLAFSGAFVFNLEEASIDCNILKDGLGIYLPKLMLYPTTLLMIAMVWGLGRSFYPEGCRVLNTPGTTLTLDTLYNAMGLVTNLGFVPLAVHTMGIFNCYSHPTGQMSMRSVPFMLCFEEDWVASMLPAGSIALLLFVFTPLSIFTYVVRHARTMPNAAERLPFLLARFRPDKYWWGLVVLARNLALALAMVVAPTKPFVVNFLLMSITIAYFYAVLRHDPWKFYGHTIVDAGMSLAFALVLTAGASYADALTYPNSRPEEQEDASWTFLTLCGTAPFFISLVAIVLCAYVGMRDSRMDKQAETAEELVFVIQRTIETSKVAFSNQTAKEDARLKEVLNRVIQLSEYDWRQLQVACALLDSLSLDKDLKGRISSDQRSIRNSSKRSQTGSSASLKISEEQTSTQPTARPSVDMEEAAPRTSVQSTINGEAEELQVAIV